MRIHAGTSGTLPREVGRSLSGQDQVFLPGTKKKDGESFRKAVKINVVELIVLRNSRPSALFFARQEHLVVAAQGATHLPREGARGACMNSHAVGPRSIWAAGLTRGSSTSCPLRGA